MTIPNTSYSAGLHMLLTLGVQDVSKITNLESFLAFTQKVLDKYGLEQVGVASHTFDNGSFTAAVCLKESHLCIHTWPEFSQLTMDVYLCNYLQDNSDKVHAVSDEFIAYFGADIISKNEISR